MALLADPRDSPSSRPKRDFRRDVAEFDRKPVADVKGEDKHAAEVLKFNGYLTLAYRDGVIIYLKTPKADRILSMMGSSAPDGTD